MKSQSSHFEVLGDRVGFNATVRHIKATVGIIDRVSEKENLADILGELLEEKTLTKDSLLPIVSMVLGEKFPYRALSSNLLSTSGDIPAIASELATWNGVDLVVVYHHPDLGVVVVNPKNQAAIASIDRVNRAELLVVWAGCFAKGGDAAMLDAAAGAVFDLFSGKTVKAKPDFLKGECVYKQPRIAGVPAPKKVAVPKAAAAKAKPSAAKAKGGKAQVAAADTEPAPLPEHKASVVAELAIKPGTRMTPMYSVLVTNELFHNGNVEAWKKIIDSYKTKHPSLEVLVYYDGERITNLNALFKWGKVKHGSMIQFAIAGEEISDVAKLQRYLSQGASNLFEAFLKGPVNAVLTLF
ncbi:MAG: hypothetical protein WCL50_00885 [Spirochaetota bacterium]